MARALPTKAQFLAAVGATIPKRFKLILPDATQQPRVSTDDTGALYISDLRLATKADWIELITAGAVWEDIKKTDLPDVPA